MFELKRSQKMRYGKFYGKTGNRVQREVGNCISAHLLQSFYLDRRVEEDTSVVELDDDHVVGKGPHRPHRLGRLALLLDQGHQLHTSGQVFLYLDDFLV